MTAIGNANEEVLKAEIEKGLAMVRRIVAADLDHGRVVRAQSLKTFAEAAEEYIRRLRNGFEGVQRDLERERVAHRGDARTM